jgi:putative transposase
MDRVHAWVLMDNYYHLFIEKPEANLVEGMKWLQNTFTKPLQREAAGGEKVFGDRYKSVVVEGIARLLWELGRLHLP